MTTTHQIVAALSLKEQLAEMLMLDIRYFGTDATCNALPFTQMTPVIEQFLKDYPLGGIALFRENFVDVEQTVALTNSLQQHAKFGRLLGIDQEGGVVTRLKFATNLTGNMALGATNQPAITTEAAQIIARELNVLGLNLNFAPVIDVNVNPLNPIIGVRAFASSAKLVGEHGRAYIAGLHAEHVISCAKHFPGHGDTISDTHLGTSYVKHSLTEIQQIDLKPFAEIIQTGVDTIMTAHVVAPALDNGKLFSTLQNAEIDTPATLSKTILTDLLRQQLGFKGVILTDAMDMHAISSNFSAVQASLLAIQAGVDMLVMPIRIWDDTGIAKFKLYFDELYNHLLNNAELQALVSAACSRIISLKINKVKPQLEILKARSVAQQQLRAKNIVKCQQHPQRELDIAKQAITLQANRAANIPFKLHNSSQLLIISDKPALLELSQQIIQTQNPQLKHIKYLLIDYTQELCATTKQAIALADQVLVLSYNLKTQHAPINQLFNCLNTQQITYALICCRNPYDVLIATESSTNTLIYGASGFDQTNYAQQHFSLNLTAALEKILAGETPEQFNQHCPVELN